ncbi:MAG: SPASM domain-containing protein, partial [Sedimentisphaerales bacterium]|nr:SPASM domain-containing protein [Sedimentisphaerales bacterium]
QEGIDLVYFQAIRNRGGTTLDIETGGDNPTFSPLSKKGRALLPCRYLWEGLFVYWNGDVGVCCEDNAARRIVIGNVADQCLEKIWAGEKMKNLRKLHLNGNRHLHAICGKQCSYNTAWLFQEN